ncbi:MAG TPA: TIGR01458 family HAD-type hydrolase [Longimicrobiales bacterium]|nr:TIGR01458 family HAD-type hydrolase [Longimicrobiales bacterium]
MPMHPAALLLDLDGTLYVGEDPVPGAPEALRALAERGVPRRYLTNTTRRSRRELAARLRALGYPAEPAELFTAPVAAAAWLADAGISRAALYLPRESWEDFPGIEIVDHAPEAVVVGDLGDGWDFATLNRAFRQVMDGARLVALQKNRYWMTERGITLDAGPFVAALEYASGRPAHVVGKPSPDFFRLALASLPAGARPVAVVGDDVETDIAGAQAAGLLGVLVRTGKYRPDVLAASGIVPDAVLASAAELPALFDPVD